MREDLAALTYELIGKRTRLIKKEDLLIRLGRSPDRGDAFCKLCVGTMIKLHRGDSLKILRTLPDCSVQCVVTSPPYWGLRDYGVAGQLGLEKTPEEYVARIVEVFARGAAQCCGTTGRCGSNMGDSYASGEVGRHDALQAIGACDGATGISLPGLARSQQKRQQAKLKTGLKPKDLVGIPWRLAFALQADGWYLRSDIIWHKPNPMPESVRDRPTKAHEYVFLMSKSQRYFYDQEAVREDATYAGKVVNAWREICCLAGKPMA